MTVSADISGFSLRGQSYPNHGLVLRDLIGESVSDPDNRLHCVSDLSDCCSSGAMDKFRGNFYFPDGATVQTFDSITDGYYRNRGSDRIFLNRRVGTIEGLFQCRITSQSSPTTPEEYYIGVYNTGSGEY